MSTKSFIIAMFLMFSWTIATHSADTVYPEHPKDIRIVGALLAPTERAREDVIAVNIFLGDTPRLLRLGKVEDLTPDEKERAVDGGILMRQVRFYGPDNLIHRLEQPDIVGKVLTIEGRLDAKERRFLVKSVKEAQGEELLSPMVK